MKKTLIGVWLFLAGAVAWALPTVQQVQAEVQQGRYPQAEAMMREVVDAKPGSAKAHYIYAEILAHNGSFSRAADEARKAKELDPGIQFTRPEKFQAFERLLEREHAPVPRSQTSNSRFPAAATGVPVHAPAGGVPSWVWLAALGVMGYLLWRGFSRSRPPRRQALHMECPQPCQPTATPPRRSEAARRTRTFLRRRPPRAC